ncbi:hypothetical protein M9Y10_013825 [Tritrichomonas musculus]|uniref:FCP1 homology domain-containing protein n=1 Tax=Tritrichomonas musculus TaxID=1915356 RepID=A0ABR2KXW1_9EUKA
MNILIAHTPKVIDASVCNANMAAPSCVASQAPVLNKQKVTLILDLDETLIHSSFIKPDYFDFIVPVTHEDQTVDIYVQKRPGFNNFIRAIAYEFDVFIFTASMSEYAVPVIQTIIPGFPLSRILTRNHCRPYNGSLVKDISIFRRDLSRMIIVDNSAESFALQQENGILISTWTGDKDDAALQEELLPFLHQCSMADDVRSVITRSYSS